MHPKRTMVFDPAEPLIDPTHFTKHDWHDFYRGAQEKIPAVYPEPLGNYVSMYCFVDADHASDRATRKSHTGVLILLNRAPIIWYSKRQPGVETSTHGSEFMAMKIAVELIEALRYKMRMFRIPFEGPTSIFCDNNAVVLNSSVPDSTLAKKHNSVSYHRVREAVAAGTVQITKEDTLTNLVDPFTKMLTAKRREELFDLWLY
jgi:hypothetical protein